MDQLMRSVESSAVKKDTATVVRSGDSYRAQQGPRYSPGVSAESVGSEALWLGIVTLEPGRRTKAHVHARHETAFYMLEGQEVELYSGERLEDKNVARPGDYLFIPANVAHVAVNRTDQSAVFIGSRNEPTAQESVVLHPELDSLVP